MTVALFEVCLDGALRCGDDVDARCEVLAVDLYAGEVVNGLGAGQRVDCDLFDS